MGAMQAAAGVLRDYGLAVVTGGSSGIGKSFIAATREANPAMRICNLSRAAPDISDVRHFACDFADRASRHVVFPRVAAWVAERPEQGRVLLINNAGFGTYGAFPEPKASVHLDLIEVNIAAIVDLTAALLPALRRRGGAVINVASTAAFQPVPLMQTYAATKAFVLQWSVALAEEFGRRSGVRVLALCPGPTRTGFHQRASLGTPAASDPLTYETEDVVATAFRALRRGRVIVVPGFFNRVLAIAATHVPRRLAAHAAKKILQRYRLPSGR